MRSYFALITPLGGGSGNRPDNSLPGSQPGIDNELPGGQPGVDVPVFPTNPIVIPPDSMAPGVPSHPIYIPPIINIPGFPTHPIVIPPDAIEPGVPSHPIHIPIGPDNSLPGSQPGIDNTLPGSQPKPDQGLPGSQPGIDNTLPPGISNELPPLPTDLPSGTKFLVAAQSPGGESTYVWYYVKDDGTAEQLPPTAQPKPSKKK